MPRLTFALPTLAGSKAAGDRQQTYSADDLNLVSSEILAQANSKADALKATGLQDEANAYSSAYGIAEANAGLEAASTQVTQLQEQRDVIKTIGSQRADVAAAGFKEAGSNLALLRNSVQQGALTQQLTGLEGAVQEGGYLAEAAASNAEFLAANTAATAATDLSTAEGTVSTLSSAKSITDIANSLGLPVPADLQNTDTTKSGAFEIASGVTQPRGSYGIPSNASIKIAGSPASTFDPTATGVDQTLAS